jgi:hypothetical protein
MSRLRRYVTAAAVTVCATAVLAAPAAAADSKILRKASPSWYTAALHEKVQAAGPEGVQIAAEELNTACPGYQAPGVSAAGCIVAPYGCTANFIYTDGTSFYVGTAGHCSNSAGEPVTMQVDTTTIADVGTVVKRTPHPAGDGIPGSDFTLIRIDPAVQERWGLNPAVPVVGGPNGVYSGCGPETVRHYGHGYVVAVGPGKPSAGVATNWFDNAYAWTGFGLPGDSGSPVVTTSGQAAGNFTHLIVHTGALGSNLAGMRMTSILNFAGVSLLNADGSVSTGPRSASCGEDPEF